MTQVNRQRGAQETRTRRAYKIMQQVYQRAVANGETADQIDIAIRAAYPWGKRYAWPYKAWLIARREFYVKHGLPLRQRTSIAEAIAEENA